MNLNVELAPRLHLVVNTFDSMGGGRYIYGLGPDMVLRNDGTPSLVRASSAIAGLEDQIGSQWLLFSYYGGTYFQRNFSTDGTTAVGFGFLGSSSASNRSVQEQTVGVVRTFWKKPGYGALQGLTQYSYVWRSPWSVASGTPANAHSGMLYMDLRYVIP